MSQVHMQIVHETIHEKSGLHIDYQAQKFKNFSDAQLN